MSNTRHAISDSNETAFAKYLLLATIIFYVVVGLLWMQATPTQPITLPDNRPQAQADQPLIVGEGPDEKEHFLYIQSLAERGRIPKPSPQYRTSPEEYVSYQAQHPPLFYAVGAVIYKVARSAGDVNIWYILRAFCLLCGIGVIVFTDKAAKVAFPDRPLVAYAAAPFVAFLPMFGHMTGNLSNEPLAMLFGAAVWYQAVRILRVPEPSTLRAALILGATLGLACLTRLTALMWLPVVIIALTRGKRIANVVAAIVVLGVLLSPWLIFNHVAYGHAFLRTFDRPLLDRGSLGEFFGRGIVPAEFPVPVNHIQTLLWYAGTAWLPFWLTQFYQPDLRPIFLLIDVVIIVLLVLNLVLNIGKTHKDDAPDRVGKVIVLAALATVTFCFAALIQQQLFSDWNVVLSAGRYLVAAAPATGLLFVWALSTIRPLDKPAFAVVVAAGMLLFDISSALTVQQFYRDHPKQPEIQPITHVSTPSGTLAA